MILKLNDYRSKLLGCWMGKNIGGTIGAPFECKQQVNDVSFYTQDLKGNPPPNDDLDLQLIWLNAVEKYGRRTDASILGEYWLSYIIPFWSEYGNGKNNLRMGLVPPLSGYVNNPYRDSCGCFIRSEIWACLAPGHPEIAVRYAYEDAVIDHSHEGLYGEIFCAAMQSAAFVESDKYTLIDIGLSYIPEDSGITGAVKAAIDCYKGGMTWQEARERILIDFPGTFGVLGTPKEKLDPKIPIGKMGWDAPSNIGLMIVGWLYGEDDFGKSLCIAVNCGEDTDCTAATLGAILGIIHGIDGIPEVWKEPMGDVINTLCLNLTDWHVKIPKTVPELTDRILKLTPLFLGSEFCDFVNSDHGYTIDMLEGKALYDKVYNRSYWMEDGFKYLLQQAPFVVKHDFVVFNTKLDYIEEPFVQEGSEKKFILTIENNTNQQQWLNINWYIPDGFTVSNKSMSIFLPQSGNAKAVLEYTLTAEFLDRPKYDMFIEISCNGRHTKGIIPIVLLNSVNIKFE
jgi:ADP-ribosylglycohydrolase